MELQRSSKQKRKKEGRIVHTNQIFNRWLVGEADTKMVPSNVARAEKKECQ